MDMSYTPQAEPEGQGQGQGSSDVMSCAWLTAGFSLCQGSRSEAVSGSMAGILWPSELGSLTRSWARSLGLTLDWGFSSASPWVYSSPFYTLHLAYGGIRSLGIVEGGDTEVGVQLPSGGVRARPSPVSQLCSTFYELFLLCTPPNPPTSTQDQEKERHWYLQAAWSHL